MIPADAATVHTVAEVDEQVRMQIDANSLAHIMTILTDLYSNPVLAVVREYSTNAYDSHVEAGNPAPIEVTLPTPLDPTFKVVDRGLGLSVDEIRDVYSLYGASTKRGSNDVVGMLGLGCKSGLTYALSFTIDAVKNGVRTVAVVAKDNDGVGVIRILDTAGTDAPNGVTVTVPVRTNDVWKFTDAADEFYRYWKPGTVLVNGEQPTFIGERARENFLWLDEDVAVVKGGHSVVVMGNVAYPFTNSDRSFRHGIVAWVPMGTINFTPSREAIHVTALSMETGSAVEAFVAERFNDALEAKLAEAETAWEGLLIARAWGQDRVGRLHLRSTITLPSPAFSWAYNGYRGSRGRSHKYGLYFSDLADAKTIVTHFPYKSLSKAHKDRLYSFGLKSALVLPSGADLAMIDGRPDVITWGQVLDATPEPPKEARVKRDKTVYTFVHQGHTSNGALDPSKPIVYRDASTKAYRYESDHRLAVKFPEAQIVSLYYRQENRFKRLNPTAVSLYDYNEAEKAKALKALTDDDKLANTSLSYTVREIVGNHGKRLVDPDFKRLATVHNGFKSPTLVRAKSLEVDIPEHPLVDELMARYPLIGIVSLPHYSSNPDAVEDLISYINQKGQAQS